MTCGAATPCTVDNDIRPVYPTTTLDQCAEDCSNNPLCKSFNFLDANCKDRC